MPRPCVCLSARGRLDRREREREREREGALAHVFIYFISGWVHSVNSVPRDMFLSVFGTDAGGRVLPASSIVQTRQASSRLELTFFQFSFWLPRSDMEKRAETEVRVLGEGGGPEIGAKSVFLSPNPVDIFLSPACYSEKTRREMNKVSFFFVLFWISERLCKAPFLPASVDWLARPWHGVPCRFCTSCLPLACPPLPCQLCSLLHVKGGGTNITAATRQREALVSSCKDSRPLFLTLLSPPLSPSPCPFLSFWPMTTVQKANTENRGIGRIGLLLPGWVGVDHFVFGTKRGTLPRPLLFFPSSFFRPRGW
ncbi:hypothetical protein LX36DRAFT_283280 [Colletotrichum falcatum]|nr:hypothetical protein LX36DRAFT_283280 [Colletotrichum falcatum]